MALCLSSTPKAKLKTKTWGAEDLREKLSARRMPPRGLLLPGQPQRSVIPTEVAACFCLSSRFQRDGRHVVGESLLRASCAESYCACVFSAIGGSRLLASRFSRVPRTTPLRSL